MENNRHEVIVTTDEIYCPMCGRMTTKLFFRDLETDVSGYRCIPCGCTFIVLRDGTIPDTEDEREEHARDIWPN